MALFALLHRSRRPQEAQLAHALRSVPLFAAMPAADLVAIWRCLRAVQAPAGTVLCRRGDPGDRFYVVQAGTLAVQLGLGPAGVPIRRVGPGDFVGEMALLTGAPRSEFVNQRGVVSSQCWPCAEDGRRLQATRIAPTYGRRTR